VKPGPKPRDLSVRLAERSRPTPSGCIEWTGALLPTGYGSIYVPALGRTETTHRVAYRLSRGEIPADMVLDHICMNRRCINVSHLRLATRAQNAQHSPGRGGKSKYKGVAWDAQTRSWRASIMACQKEVYLGRHSTPEAAALAYNEAARVLHGEFAYLNEVAA
jgi:hypothetical protein